MKSDPTFWILARAAGLTAYVLLTGSVLAGLVLKSRVLGRAVRPAAVTDVHRFLALLGLGFVGLHAIALVLDQTVHMPVAALVVPWLSTYRPTAVALGVIAAEVAGLIVVSFPLRRRIGARTWRRLHWASYLVFGLGTIHGLSAGTDSAQPWAAGIYLGAVGAVVFAITYRALALPKRPRSTFG
jgi:sulfoxide reductase heme-binding subunit YedZ